MALSDIAFTKWGWRKSEICEILKDFHIMTVRNIINTILAKEMNIPLDEAKNIKTIKSSIAKKILEEFE